jgi:hypothetical protein
MAQVEMDLRTLLDQDRQLALEVLEASRKLVLDLEAPHLWTVQCLETFALLGSIGNNLKRLIEACAPYWPEGHRVFAHDEGRRLWKSAQGLWRALPPELARLNDQLARRRRQRIMGDKFDEPAELTAEQIAEDLGRFKNMHAGITKQFEALAALVAIVPPGLSPTAEDLEAPAVAEPGPVPDAAPAPKPGQAVGPDELSPA